MMKHKWKLISILPILISGCRGNQNAARMECIKHQDVVLIAQPDGFRDIYIVNLDGSELEKLTEPTNSYVYYSSAKWSPDGCQIAFLTDLDRGHENAWGFVPMDIFVMNSDGTGIKNLTKNDAHNHQISWSPNGKKILFASDIDGDFDIYVINSDGTSLQQLIKNDISDTYPQWSPNGQQIIFLSNQNGDDDSEIFMANADGTGLRQLTDNHYDEWQFKWSPDGTQIAYTSIMNKGSEVSIMNVNGSNSYRVTRNQVWDTIIDWSEYGSQLFYTSDLEETVSNLYVFSLSENVSSLVTDMKIYDSSVVVLPYKNMALVGVNVNSEFYLIQLDRSNFEQIDFNIEKVLDFDWR